MSGVTNDRWSCDVCGQTLIVNGTDAAVRFHLRVEQERHGRAHAAAAQMPMPEPRRA